MKRSPPTLVMLECKQRTQEALHIGKKCRISLASAFSSQWTPLPSPNLQMTVRDELTAK
jgi:hypothetical protein